MFYAVIKLSQRGCIVGGMEVGAERTVWAVTVLVGDFFLTFIEGHCLLLTLQGPISSGVTFGRRDF